MTATGCQGEYPCRRLVKSKTRVHDLNESTPGDDAGTVIVTEVPILHPYRPHPHRRAEKTVPGNAATCRGAPHKSRKLFFNWSCVWSDLDVFSVRHASYLKIPQYLLLTCSLPAAKQETGESTSCSVAKTK